MAYHKALGIRESPFRELVVSYLFSSVNKTD